MSRVSALFCPFAPLPNLLADSLVPVIPDRISHPYGQMNTFAAGSLLFAYFVLHFVLAQEAFFPVFELRESSSYLMARAALYLGFFLLRVSAGKIGASTLS